MFFKVVGMNAEYFMKYSTHTQQDDLLFFLIFSSKFSSSLNTNLPDVSHTNKYNWYQHLISAGVQYL